MIGDDMKIRELASIIDGYVLDPNVEDRKVGSIHIDSRTLKKGQVFLAFKGKNFDGHDFLKEALKKKPSCLIVREGTILSTKIPIIYVKDPNQAFFDIAKDTRNQFLGLVIAITGSCGKTSTKDYLYHILSQQYRVTKSEKNYNNKIGVSKTLLNIPQNTQILLLECGTNHPGEMKEIEMIVKPDIVLMTNIGTSHLGNFRSKRAILKEKMALVKPMEEGVLFVHGEDNYLCKLRSSRIEIFKTYNRKSLLNLKRIQCTFEKSIIDLEYQKIPYSLEVPIFSKGMIDNLLLAIECALFLNISMNQILASLTSLPVLENRLEKKKLSHHNLLISDCYNASYESVCSLLETIKPLSQHKAIILGDMKELGKWSKKLHRSIGKLVKNITNKELYLVGEETKEIQKLNKGSIWFSSNEELIMYLQNKVYKDTIFAVKGAHSMKLEEISSYLEKKYS